MKDCAIHIPISLGMEKNSPLKPMVDKYLRRLIEAGLTNKWLADAIQDFQSSVEEEPQEALMDLKKFYGALIALAVGYFLSTLVLISEVLYWKYVVQKHPAFDKYNMAKFYETIRRK